jgi:putative membrane protein
MRISRFLKQFNWRFLLVRIVVNALALAVTAAIVPEISFVDESISNWLLMAFMLGVLNALLKPILQVLMLQFLFVTYGLVLVVVNALILLLLSILFPARFEVTNLLWALVGGLVLGLLSSFLESLLGLTMPIVPDELLELRHRLEEQARPVNLRAATRRKTVPAEQALAPEPPAGEAKAAAGPAVAGAAGAEPVGAEPYTPRPEEGPSPPAEVEAEPSDSTVAPSASVDPEPEPEPREEQKEDPS